MGLSQARPHLRCVSAICRRYADPVRQNRLPWLMAPAAAALWTVAHLVVHGPRGWPMNVLGEWDLLLTALAIAAGDAPDAAIGTLHGNELGSWLVAAVVALPIRLGLDPVAAGKCVAVAFGASTAAVIVWLATWLSRESRTASLAAGGLAGLLVAVAWPGFHFELQGVNGRTPEALLFQLLAVVLVVTAAESGGLAAGRRRGVLLGAVLSVGWLMSPVVLWTAGVAAVLFIWRILPEAEVAGDRARTAGTVAGCLAAGFLAPLLLFVVLVPGGGEGLQLFLVDQLGGGLGVAPGEAERLGPAVFGKVGHALEGGAHSPGLVLRPLALAAIGWALLLGLALALGRALWRRRLRDPAGSAAALGLSWLVPLAVLPLDKWFYPLAYRYWVLLLALGLAVLPSLLALRGRTGRIACATLAALALAITPSLPRSIVAPSASRAQALVSSGAHRMNPRPGRDRHAAFSALFPHVAEADRPPLAEGYGLALGGDMAVLIIDERFDRAPWDTVQPPLEGAARQSFLVGIGCGVTAVGVVPAGAVAAFTTAPRADRPALFYGLGRCGVDPARQPTPAARDAIEASRRQTLEADWMALGAGLRDAGQPEDALDLAVEHSEFVKGWEDPTLVGVRSMVPNPAELMPPRWTD